MTGTIPEDFSRVNRPLTEAAKYYSRLAPWYDFLASSEKRFILKGLTLLDPLPGEKVLEIGSGTGYAQERIIPSLKDGFSAAVDISPGMADLAQKRLRQLDLWDHSGLAISDSLPLPFQANSFDAIFSSFTLELFDTPHIPILLSECRRVLKPEGRMAVVSLSKESPLGVMGRLYEWFHDHFPTIADCRPIPVRHLLEENGFVVIEFKKMKMWGLPVSLVKAKL